jgi:hypothetical protein
MLWTLVAAGIVGAIAVLLGPTEVTWESVGTLIVMAVGFGLLLLISRTLAGCAPAALLATALVIVEFFLALIGIWDLEQTFKFIGDRWVELMPTIFAAGLPAVICLKQLGNPRASVAARTGLALCAATFLIWLIAIARMPYILNGTEQWWSYGNALGGLGVLAVFCLVGVGTDRWHWRWAGVVTAAAAYMVCVRIIRADEPEFQPQPLVALTWIAVFIAYANVLLRCPLRPNQKWLAYASLSAMALAGLFINLAAMDHFRSASASYIDPRFDRPAAAASILAACGTLGVAVLVAINRRSAPALRDAAELIKDLKLTVICPVCRHKQTFGKDGGVCAGCGLRINVTVEEPRCPACGYSLLMLKSNRCPECGAPAAAPTPPALTKLPV